MSLNIDDATDDRTSLKVSSRVLLKRWVSHHSVLIGRAHIRGQQPCQDRSHGETYRDRLVAVVCDGAGSCAMSHKGADFCCRQLPKMLKSKKLTEALLRATLAELQVALKRYAESLGVSPKELSCTLNMVIITQQLSWFVQLGDSIALAQSSSDEWAQEPMNGEYSNETFFITHPRAPELAKISRIYLNDELLLLCTDGVSGSLVSYQQGRKPRFAPVVSKLRELTAQSPAHQIDEVLNSQLMPLFQGKTFDDCGIAVIYGSEVMVDWLQPSTLKELITGLFPDQDKRILQKKSKILAVLLEIIFNENPDYRGSLWSQCKKPPMIQKVAKVTKVPKKTVLRLLRSLPMIELARG